MLIPKTEPVRLAAAAILGVTLPLWLLGLDLPEDLELDSG
jgi:hypothetical protein